MIVDIDRAMSGEDFRPHRKFIDRWCYFGGGSEKTESKTTTDPALLALYNQNYAKASSVADNFQYQPYTGEKVAGFTPTQITGQQGLLSAANDPTSATNLNTAASGAKGILGGFDPAKFASYLNPETDNVVNASMADLQHAHDVQRVADQQASTANHAFGYARSGVRDAVTNDNYARTAATASANLRSNAFDKAMGAYQTGNNQELAAGQSLANISDQQLRDALTKAGVISGVGDVQQGQRQAEDDAAYQEFIRQITAPIQSQDIRNAALGMIPLQQTNTSTTTKKGDVLGGILGAIAGGAQIGSKLYGGG